VWGGKKWTKIGGKQGKTGGAKSNILILASRDIGMADIQFRQPGGMAQKTRGSISRFRSFTSMTAKLLVGVILIGTIGGCATTGKLPNNIKYKTGIIYEEGYAKSDNKKCVVGKDSKGDRQVIVYDNKKADTYDINDDGKVKKVKYNKKKKNFEIKYDGSSATAPEYYDSK